MNIKCIPLLVYKYLKHGSTRYAAKTFQKKFMNLYYRFSGAIYLTNRTIVLLKTSNLCAIFFENRH